RPVERVVLAGNGDHRDHAEIAERRGDRGGRRLGPRLVDVDGGHRLAGKVRVEAGAHRGGDRGQGRRRAGGGQADDQISGADPVDGGAAFLGQHGRVHLSREVGEQGQVIAHVAGNQEVTTYVLAAGRPHAGHYLPARDEPPD